MNFPSLPSVSIIIPVLNESGNLERCIASLPDDPDVQIIVSDGGSTDDSVEIASRLGTTVIHSAQGRAIQMNTGAKAATGDVLFFLHADTQIKNNAIALIREAVTNEFSVGCFERVFDTDSPLLQTTSKWATWRARKFFVVYGDQAIFIKRDFFETLGGYHIIDRFEDVDLAIRARKRKRWIVLPGPIIADARRFERSPLKRVIKDAWLTAAWLFGIIR